LHAEEGEHPAKHLLLHLEVANAVDVERGKDEVDVVGIVRHGTDILVRHHLAGRGDGGSVIDRSKARHFHRIRGFGIERKAVQDAAGGSVDCRIAGYRPGVVCLEVFFPECSYYWQKIQSDWRVV